MTAPFHRRALVVDDEPLILMAAVEMLDAAGYSSGEFASADAAMAHLEVCADEGCANDVVLVFTDVDMPGSMDGLAFARAIAVRWPDIAIIVASGRVMPSEGDLPDRAMFLSKPYASREVERALRRAAVAREDDRRDTPRQCAPTESMPV